VRLAPGEPPGAYRRNLIHGPFIAENDILTGMKLLFFCMGITLMVQANEKEDDWFHYAARFDAALHDDRAHRAIPPGFTHRPPGAQRILWWLLNESQTPLPDHFSCQSVVADSSGTTLGGYVSWLLQFLGDTQAHNHLSIRYESLLSPQKRPVWLCTVMVISTRGNMHLSQGVSFLVDDEQWRVMDGTLRCVGSG